MNTNTYSAPLCEVRKTRVRMSILAGSTADSRAYNGTTNGKATVPDMPIEARGRLSFD